MKVIAHVVLLFGIMGTALFASAGRLDLPWLWAVVGTYVAFAIFAGLTMDPELRRERFKPAPGGKDRNMRLILLPLILMMWIVTGLDVGRFQWSRPMPPWLKAAGLAGFLLGLFLSYWAMRVNRFFSPVVRIQSERNHVLVTDGPYGFVRHPGYLGAIVAFLCGTLAFGSWWAMLLAAVCVAVMVRRAVLEDSFLKANLAGYSAFAERVRYRLVPGFC